MKPKVYLAIDRPGWAFDHIAQQVKSRLSNEFDFCIIPYQSLTTGEADILVSFWWPPAPILRANVKAKANVVCVYDEFSWRTPSAMQQFELVARQATVLAVANKRLIKYLEHTAPSRTMLIEDGVDCQMFAPSRLPVEFTAGWTGNTEGLKRVNGPDIKGINIITEACKRAGVRLVKADASSHYRSHDEMPEWYRGISVYLCASLAEGTPNPVLEAMACGRPVISTDVGLVPQLVNAENGIIVEREIDAFVAALNSIKDRNLADMGAEARKSVEPWDWAIKIEAWRDCLRTAKGNH
jgi:hypothetical protein